MIILYILVLNFGADFRMDLKSRDSEEEDFFPDLKSSDLRGREAPGWRRTLE